jgi:hypothetical protein
LANSEAYSIDEVSAKPHKIKLVFEHLIKRFSKSCIPEGQLYIDESSLLLERPTWMESLHLKEKLLL